MGRGKLVLKKIENQKSRQVSFSKRKHGLFKKAIELSTLCDAEIAVIVFSPSGHAYHLSTHEIHRTITKYKIEAGIANPHEQGMASMEAWRNEIEDLSRTVEALEAKQKHFAGENLSELGMRELNQLERQIKAGGERIRTKMRRIIMDHIDHLKKKHKDLHDENAHLQKMIKLLEIQKAGTSSIVPGSDTTGLFYI